MSTPKPKVEKVRDYYRTEEVAELLKVSPKTIARWANEGRRDPETGELILQYTLTVGGHKRYRKTAVDTLVERMAQEGSEGRWDATQSVWVRA